MSLLLKISLAKPPYVRAFSLADNTFIASKIQKTVITKINSNKYKEYCGKTKSIKTPKLIATTEYTNARSVFSKYLSGR